MPIALDLRRTEEDEEPKKHTTDGFEFCDRKEEQPLMVAPLGVAEN